MLMNDKIIFACYYCINSAQTKEIMVHYILQPRSSHFHTHKSFHFYARSRRTSVSHYQHVLCMASGNEHK